MSADITQKAPARKAECSAQTQKRNALSRWWTRAVRHWQRRKMIAALAALDDHILDDIGIPRGQIERVVDGFDDQELRMQPVRVQADTKEKDLSRADLRRAA